MKTPRPGIEPECLKGSAFEADAVPLCHRGLKLLIEKIL